MTEEKEEELTRSFLSHALKTGTLVEGNTLPQKQELYQDLDEMAYAIKAFSQKIQGTVIPCDGL